MGQRDKFFQNLLVEVGNHSRSLKDVAESFPEKAPSANNVRLFLIEAASRAAADPSDRNLGELNRTLEYVVEFCAKSWEVV